MSDLISRSALLEEVKSLRVTVMGLRAGKGVLHEYAEQYRDTLLRIINEQPASEAAQVVHGEWKYGDWDKGGHWVSGSKKVRCSHCHRVFDSDNLNIWHWCPQCGAKMKGE